MYKKKKKDMKIVTTMLDVYGSSLPFLTQIQSQSTTHHFIQTMATYVIIRVRGTKASKPWNQKCISAPYSEYSDISNIFEISRNNLFEYGFERNMLLMWTQKTQTLPESGKHWFQSKNILPRIQRDALIHRHLFPTPYTWAGS